MAEQQQRNWDLADIRDEKVLRAMEKVERHLFVPEEQAELAYENKALPIGHGQTISQPFIVAYMTAELQLKATDKVLEIGTGSGYQGAILAEIADRVYSVELDPRLADVARDRLRRLGYDNIEVKVGDGYDGWVEQAPFDAIIVTAAAEDVPAPLLDQLKDGGRMVIPIGTPYGPQELICVQKHGRTVSTNSLLSVRFVPFRRKLDPGG